MLQEQLSPEIRSLIEARRWTELSSKRVAWPAPDTVAPDLADLLVDLDKTDRMLFFRALPRPLASEVFAHLEADPEARDALLSALTDGEMRGLLARLSPDDRAALLDELPGQVTQRLLNVLSPTDLAEVRQLLGYPEESVGRLMTPDYVAVRPEWTIEQALEHIRRRGRASETIDIIYVHDEQWKLLDALPLRRFIVADPEARVSDIMDGSFVALSAYDDREEAVRAIQRYDRVALPVVDSSGILLGIVTVDDILDVVEEEFTEDFQRFAAMEPIKEGYWQTSRWRLYRSRVGWLAALVMVGLVSSGVIAAFEDVLSEVVALSFFIPLLMGAGGNTGSQSATITIRSISTGEVELSEWARVFFKEVVIGAALGLSLGALGMVLGVLQGGGFSLLGFEIGLVIFLTMTIMLTLTNLLGMSLPFVLTRLGLDPASASGPMVASISDAIGLLIYFSVARLVLGI